MSHGWKVCRSLLSLSRGLPLSVARPDAVILDVGLPDIGGCVGSWNAMLRCNSFLTARSDEVDRFS